MLPDDAGDYQAANMVPGVIYARGAHHCSIENCTLKNLGTYGVEFDSGCWDNHFSENELAYLGAGGYKITGSNANSRPVQRTGRNVITDNYIHHMGEVFHSAVGVWLGNTESNTVTHNEIHHLYYTGISVG